MSVFQERLLEIMTDKNIKAATIARETNISRSTISKYLTTDDKQHETSIVLRIAKFLNVAPEWLYGEIDDPRPFSLPTIAEVYEALSPEGQKKALDYASYLLDKEQEANGGEK